MWCCVLPDYTGKIVLLVIVGSKSLPGSGQDSVHLIVAQSDMGISVKRALEGQESNLPSLHAQAPPDLKSGHPTGRCRSPGGDGNP